MGSSSSKTHSNVEYSALLNGIDQSKEFDVAFTEDETMNAFATWLNDDAKRARLSPLLALVNDSDRTARAIKRGATVPTELMRLWDAHLSPASPTGEAVQKLLKAVESPLTKLGHYAGFVGRITPEVRQEALGCLEAVVGEARLLLTDAYNDFLDAAMVVQTGKPSGGLFGLSARRRAYLRDLIAFFICGLINNFGYVVMLSAADHIGGKLPESATLLADILPTFIIKLTAPFFMDRIPYKLRIAFAILTSLASFQLVAWGPNSAVKLLGVVFASISSGLGEITFLALSAFYHRNVVSAWSSGTGAAGIVGATWYLAFTAWFTFIKQENRPFTAMIACSLLPLLMAFAYYILMSPVKRPLSTASSSDSAVNDANSSSREIQPLEAPIDEESEVETESNADLDLAVDPIRPLTIKQRAKMIPTLLWYIIPLLLVYFGEYLINQGVDPSLVWPGTAISCQEYRYYQFLYQSGVFISRSSVNFFRIKNIWWLPLLQILNLNILTLQAIYHFIPYYWIVFLIVIFEGLLGGATYVNVFYALSTETTGIVREYSMSITSVADSIGISLAALVGLQLGPFLKALNNARILSGNCPAH